MEVAGSSIKEIEVSGRNRLFAVAYDGVGDVYDLMCIDSSDPANMSELWRHPFGPGGSINALRADGNRILVAGANGVDIIIPPLEDVYVTEVGTELKITVYAADPDGDLPTYTIDNKPDFPEAEFIDNGDGTATLRWIPEEDQIGVYENIVFTASDANQDAVSPAVKIVVVEREEPAAIDENIKLLLHLDYDDGFSDESYSSHAVAVNGDTYIDSSDSQAGTGSGLFDGYGDSLALADHEDWSFDGGDFTVDFWMKLDNNSSWSYCLGNADGYISGSYNEGWGILCRNRYLLYFEAKSGGHVFERRATPVLDANTWYHVAVVRTNGDIKIYLNGVAQHASYGFGGSRTDLDSANPLSIGREPGRSVAYFNGHMDEVRISKGIARWTDDFTPPDDY